VRPIRLLNSCELRAGRSSWITAIPPTAIRRLSISAADSQALLGCPFEHADTLTAALARQQEIDALMHAEAEPTAKTAAQSAAEQPAEPTTAAG
jgi:hypothetical protein